MTRPLKQVLRRIIRFLLFAAVAAALGNDGANGQINAITGNNQVLGTWDASQAARTNSSRTGTGSPVGRDSCLRAGESYFQTDATAGQNNWSCVAPGSPGSWANSSGFSAIACVGTTGNTVGSYYQQRVTSADAVYTCNN